MLNRFRSDSKIDGNTIAIYLIILYIYRYQELPEQTQTFTKVNQAFNLHIPVIAYAPGLP
jgi:hypothetical protein